MSEETKPRQRLKDVFGRNTSALGAGGARSVPRRKLAFVVDHTVCAPGVFDEDFELGLVSLSPDQELAAARESKGDAATMAMMMARKSLATFNGAPIEPGEDEWLWQALDAPGRQLVMAMFVNIGTPGEAVLGKAIKSLIVS